MRLLIELQIAKGQREGIEYGAPEAEFWILVLTLPLTTCETLGRSLNSEPWFPYYMQNGGISGDSFMEL